MYAQSYKQKKVIKLAPDAVIKINGNVCVSICPVCDGTVNVSQFLTSLSTSLSNNSTIGTANFNLAMPRHGHEGKYMVRGGRVFGINLMDEVEIFIKGRFQTNTGESEYYPCFWGMVSSITETYSDGSQEIQVSCESMLKWMQLMKTNEHPSVQFRNDGVAQSLDSDASLVTGKTFAQKTPYEMIYSLVDITFLNIVVTEALDTEIQDINMNKQTQQRDAKGNIVPIKSKSTVVSPRDNQLMEYWKNKFSEEKGLKGRLKMFGTTDESFVIRNNSKRSSTNQTEGDSTMAGSKDAYSPMKIFHNSKSLMDFKPYFKTDDAKDLGVVQNSYKNNLQLANEVKLFTGFEFYLDTTGDLVFKPPFWNMDTRLNKVYVLEDTDILNWGFSEDDSQVVTRVEVHGSLTQTHNLSSEFHPVGAYTNYSLAAQFGLRTESISMRFFTSVRMCYYHAISEMDRINANRFRGSITIVGRPELRLGMPIYIESRDCFAYVDNISHNFSFRGPFTTQVSVSAIRRKYLGDDPKSAGKLESKMGNTLDLKIKGGAKILLYQAETVNTPDATNQNISVKNKKEVEEKLVTTSAEAKKNSEEFSLSTGNMLKTNRFGLYKEVSLTHKDAIEALMLADDAKKSDNQNAYLDFLEKAIPVSDEEGYELIGVYENGRSVYLSPKNVMRKKDHNFSSILNNVLNGKSKQKKEYVASMGVTRINVVTGDTMEDVDSSKELQGFLTSQAIRLSSLVPEQTKSSSGCGCSNPSLAGENKASNEKKRKPFDG